VNRDFGHVAAWWVPQAVDVDGCACNASPVVSPRSTLA
jgi:hypothetical protein